MQRAVLARARRPRFSEGAYPRIYRQESGDELPTADPQLDAADNFCMHGFPLAAAVHARVVLERHAWRLARRRGLAISSTASVPELLQRLRQRGVIRRCAERRLRHAWYTASRAAHGREVTAGNLAKLLVAARWLVTQHPIDRRAA